MAQCSSGASSRPAPLISTWPLSKRRISAARRPPSRHGSRSLAPLPARVMPSRRSSMSETPSLALPLLAAEQAQKHVTMNEALGLLDAVVQLAAKDRDLAAPPGAPAEGDRYIVATSPTGDWAGQAGKIAVYQNAGWTFLTPREGWLAWIDDENVVLGFTGAAWTNLSTLISALQNLTLLGVGT